MFHWRWSTSEQPHAPLDNYLLLGTHAPVTEGRKCFIYRRTQHIQHILFYGYMEWMNEWMFNDTPARKTDRLLGVRKR